MTRRLKLFGIIFALLVIVSSLAYVLAISDSTKPQTLPISDPYQGNSKNDAESNLFQSENNDEDPVDSDSSSSVSSRFINPGSAKFTRSSNSKTTDSNIDTPDDGDESEPRIWLPTGRFVSEVFDANDITTQTVNFGSMTNYSGNTEQLYLTISMPKTTVDPEIQRPLILAMPGGNTIGFCDSTLTTEQSAMLRLAKLGYVGITLTPLLDNDFCDGADNQAYYQNMIINNEAVNKALDYLNLHAEDFNLDINRAALFGYSIGGQTALLKVREDYDENPFLRTIIAFSSIVLQDSESNSILSPLAVAGDNAPEIYMLSFEPDIGFGPGATPDARGDCETLVTLGYNCTFQGIPVPGHSIHTNTIVPCSFLASLSINCYELDIPIVDDSVSAPAIIEPYLYQKLIAE